MVRGILIDLVRIHYYRFRIFLPCCLLLAASFVGCNPPNPTNRSGGKPDAWVSFNSAFAGFSAATRRRRPRQRTNPASMPSG